MSLQPPSESDERKCKNGFIESYLHYTDMQEAPEDYHLWCALSIVGSALNRKCYIDQGFFRIYPNLYVILVGESGITTKSTTVNISTNMLMESIGSNIHLSPSTSTRAGMIEDLAKRLSETGTSDIHIANGEFTNFIGDKRNDNTFVTFISTQYDCLEIDSNKTLGRGLEDISKGFCNILTGSTEEWFKTGLEGETIGGGFYSRLIPVVREPSGKTVPFPALVMKGSHWEAKANCIHDLHIIQKLSGEFKWSNAARNVYENWYTDPHFDPTKNPKNLWGYYTRKRTSVLKIAMMCSAMMNNSMILQDDDLLYALDIMQGNERYMNSILKYITQTEEGARIDKVRQFIRTKGPVLRSKVLMNLSNSGISAKILDEVLLTLGDSGTREVGELRGKGTTYIYKEQEG